MTISLNGAPLVRETRPNKNADPVEIGNVTFGSLSTANISS